MGIEIIILVTILCPSYALAYPMKYKLVTDNENKTIMNVNVVSDDGKCVLTIENGTLVSDRTKKVVQEITITKIENILAESGDMEILAAYKIEPYHATFEPSAKLQIAYDFAYLNVGVKIYDNGWSSVPTNIDIKNNKIFAELNKTGIIALFVKKSKWIDITGYIIANQNTILAIIMVMVIITIVLKIALSKMG